MQNLQKHETARGVEKTVKIWVFASCCKKLEVEALTKKHEINEPDYQAVIFTHIPYHCPTGRNKAA